jgi:RHH-type proline utilization regulon transcriptional repressor/proline dehydrogenase/delta 1-pyrroline-5-carboxylate dehydrogenase
MTIEPRVREHGERLLGRVRERQSARGAGWLDTLIGRVIRDEAFRIQALRFVDVLPVLGEDRDLVRHLQEYFGGLDLPLPGIAEWGLRHSDAVWAMHVAAPVVRRGLRELAHRFMGGRDCAEALRTVSRLREQGMNFTLDHLGEATVSEAEAQRYQAAYLDLIETLPAPLAAWKMDKLLDESNGRASPRLNLSLKLSSLYSQINPLDPAGSVAAIGQRLRPLLRLAREHQAFITFDMEQYDFRHIVLECFRVLFMEEEFRDWPDAGVALQAYLKETEDDLQAMLEWVERRGTPVTIRLTRGAYWDYETVIAGQNGWTSPVRERKPETDAAYERCLRRLVERHPAVEVAVATHNVRSIACAMALAEAHGTRARDFEFQMLYGMGDALKEALVGMGYRLRVYVPYGETLPGMAYLVRRLLENGTGQTILDSTLGPGEPDDALLARPAPAPASRYESLITHDTLPFENTPPYRFTAPEEREAFAEAIARVRDRLGEAYPLVIGGRPVHSEEAIVSINPSRPEQVIGRVAAATTRQADAALAAALGAFPGWSARSAAERAALLRAVARRLQMLRTEFAAWQVLEAGKNWREADADVCEAIDFLNYYALQAERLVRPRVVALGGEHNQFGYRPRGVGLVIPPWNFPLAILAGMLAATIVTGNTAILKPSSSTPVIAARFMQVLDEAGMPDGVVNFLPGSGATVGEYLAARAEVKLIAFTGSQQVGTRLIGIGAQLQPGQRHVKRVIAEMGGKNALVIDADADFDDAILGTVHSAFGYQGQKCSAASRVIVVDAIHDAFVERLIEATRSLTVGDPAQPGHFMGPVIDAAARDRIMEAIRLGREDARLALFDETGLPHEGFYVPPAIFTEVHPESPLAQEEIFGPVLAVIRADDFEHALEIANGTRYALTGGVYSRHPGNLQRAREAFLVGNLYLNRKITGALVSRQPFGGFGLSGIGTKAGGEDYLLQFMDPVCVTENTLRRGFAPSPPGDATETK